MLPLTGYLDRFSARPGEALSVKVSSTLAGPYHADLVRVIHADPNPAGPGMKIRDLPAAFAGEYPSRAQPVQLGSYGVVPPSALLARSGFTLRVRVQPFLLDENPRCVIALGGPEEAGWSVTMTAAGTTARLRGRRGDITCAVAAPPVARTWYELLLRVGPQGIALRQRPVHPVWGLRDDAGEAHAGGGVSAPPPAPLSIGALLTSGGPVQVFDGRIEDPQLFDGTPDELPDDATRHPALLAFWDFSRGIGTQVIEETGPHGLHGSLRNLPMRAVRGSRWSGQEMCWRHAPRDYAAIHFHADDLDDCGWETDFTVRIPEDMPSGAYGIRLRGGDEEEILPFYVLPPRGTATARIAFLASTFTYQAYANHARGNCDEDYKARRAEWSAYPHNPDEHHDYAHSTYNRHPDNTGIAFSTRLRPILTMRPGFLTFNDARGSGLRHYPADSHLIDWLDAQGFAVDIITDEDLDNEGAELLRPYRVVLTGSHPEYHTARNLDAIQSYLSEGGKLCYLGGNGFYWRIARDPAMPHIIEIRRAEGGIRAWAAEPGEYFQQLDGGYGGLWRRNGRAPQSLAAVGFSGQGLFEGSYYRRLPASHAPDMECIFEGVEEEILGDGGLSGGGAAGFELDRADPLLGTPPGAHVLARSEAHQDHFVTVPEELLSHLHTVTGEPPRDLIRAEIVYADTARGGAIFATGSITFCGSLSQDAYDNPFALMLANVVCRFAA